VLIIAFFLKKISRKERKEKKHAKGAKAYVRYKKLLISKQRLICDLKSFAIFA
jgi:hypothetical protein